MKTPASKRYLDEVGKAVHYLNTVVVGLAGVETEICKKPDSLDVSWNPSDARSSSRSARSYVLKSSIVFLAAELSAYVNELLKSPACSQLELPKDSDKAERFRRLTNHMGIIDVELSIGPLLIIHWRNRIIHHNSNARLSSTEKRKFREATPEIPEKYKNLDPALTLDHFDKGTPSLKDVSSLIAMSINWAKAMEARLPEPTSYEELLAWLEATGLSEEFDRAKRVSANAAKPASSMANFFVTYCPGLKNSYDKYGAAGA
ncbi:MAG: hypothetical protein PF483_03475 [Halothiobacillus sp.]|jgi:hypothetical protein|nr:hypothetical protein [Halothiobacillus sp.]